MIEDFSFIEFTSGVPDYFDDLFTKLGFEIIKEQNSKIFEQGSIRFVINSLTNFQLNFQWQHGPSVCAIGFVDDEPDREVPGLIRDGEAFLGIGGSRIYMTKRLVPEPRVEGVGLQFIDHLTNNVRQGNMDLWASFYEKFGFKEIRYFDIKGKKTGLRSRAMGVGRIAIPINEPTDDKSQIAEYIEEYDGEGVQHIALHTDDIYATVEKLRSNGINFLDIPDTYYEAIDERIPDHGENIDKLQQNKILIDGSKNNILLQIFTKNYIGPIFFEIIQRKGNNGFGDGNFQALFEAIEQDQIHRGVLDG